jgi:hypothetical protein
MIQLIFWELVCLYPKIADREIPLGNFSVVHIPLLFITNRPLAETA